MYTCYNGIGYELLFIHLQSKELRIKMTQPAQPHLFNFVLWHGIDNGNDRATIIPPGHVLVLHLPGGK